MTVNCERPITIETKVLDEKTGFRRVRYGKDVYNITSIFEGAEELKDILHKIAIRKIEKLN